MRYRLFTDSEWLAVKRKLKTLYYSIAICKNMKTYMVMHSMYLPTDGEARWINDSNGRPRAKICAHACASAHHVL